MRFPRLVLRGVAVLPLLGLLAPTAPGAAAQAVTEPNFVSVPGSFNQEIGCPGDWQPDCNQAQLSFDSTDQLWTKIAAIPAPADGNPYNYKVAINKSWDENYGRNAVRGGADIPLPITAPTDVKFYYSHATKWVANNVTDKIATVAGSFQSELGCPGDWQPDCLRSWMQDVDGDGKYTFSTTSIPVGTYAFKVARNEKWDESYPSDNVPLTVATAGEKVVINWNSRTNEITLGEQVGNLLNARAHWISRDTLAWNVDPAPATVRLVSAPNAGLALGLNGITGGTVITLTQDMAGLTAAQRAKFPHLAGFAAYKIGAADLANVPAMLKGQLAAEARDGANKLLDATSLQIPGVLDDLYTYGGDLGVTYNGTTPTLRLWAPTAQDVKLHVFGDATTTVSSTVAMTYDGATGVWAAAGDASWTGKYYLYEVRVFTRATNTVVTNMVSDPYAISLSQNSTRSQIVNLNDPALMPGGWTMTSKPALQAPEDIVLYELHVRDFSANDQTVPEAQRGTFKAFTQFQSNGMKHLAALASSGLTTVHLLPAFDCASINEDKSTWQSPSVDLATLPPDSEGQQAAIEPIRDQDGFNWCYDPYHYTTPEGSYSTNSSNTSRILEFREMVQSLNRIGLRVVMDVVYNHTAASGQSEKSVLDKVVPGYYHRLSLDGNIEKSTCCENTATEHAMMEKLMVDSLKTWATAYKVDGFRFDLMGHHSLANITKVRDTLQSLTPANGGVDGRAIYIYGEGWNFGEVANNARFVQATQANTAGSGIGTFNDRIRDAARGGGPFSGLQEQGFATGLLTDPNGTNQGDEAAQRAKLLLHQDQIKVGLTGNLKDYMLVDSTGVMTTGASIDYNGSPAGYTSDPQEIINYVEAHDNETLFDAVQVKAPATAVITDRIRMHWMASDLVLLGQGLPFLHAGQDILRSKSFDRNSYNSGDWFNRLDWTYQTNNFGVGLPPAGENQSNWPIFKPLLANAALKPTSAQIKGSASHFREMIAIRKSSPLFRLRTAAEVQEQLSFLNTGPDQVPGLIVMRLTDPRAVHVGNPYKQVVVVFNASDETLTYTNDAFKVAGMQLHPVQRTSADATVRAATVNTASGTVSVPARTTAVFVEGKYQFAVPIFLKNR